MIPLLVIEGPTASGKSDLAITLAEILGTEIISADSRQVYRYLNIGTAKPSQEELQRVKHHLIDIVDPDQSYNSGLFVRDTEHIIDDLTMKGKIPIICGGTGLYVKSLLHGLFELPEIDPQIRTTLKRRLDSVTIDQLYKELHTCDPVFASGISVNDTQRILRGLEVFMATGKNISDHWKEQATKSKYTPYRILMDIPRDILYSRINHRLGKMIASGLLQEISDLFTRGFTHSDPGLNSLGYKEFMPYLSGIDTLESCLDKAKQYSRNYAKRQCTWYRKYDFNLTITNPDYNISEIRSPILHWAQSV